MKTRSIYWVAQFAGWVAYATLLFIAIVTRDNAITFETVLSVILWIVFGIAVTHAQRFVFLRLNWLELRLAPLIPRVLFSSTISAIVIYSCLFAVDYFLEYGRATKENFTVSNLVLGTISMAILILFWNAIYFTFHYFQKSRKQEVSNLELTASNRESELKNLRSQLNPHFLFNSLNSIRALVDIEPAKAKKSITTLSNLLRQSLMIGKENIVTVEQELDSVRNYLDLEKIRFEERLNVQWEIDDSLLSKEIPPFSVQMMAENAVKHGISNRKEGGDVIVSIIRSDVGFSLQIKNSGVLGTKIDLGVGIQNIKQRLKLQFGSTAKYSLVQIEGHVVAKIEFTDERI